jgi:hypothetical protein
MKDNVEIMGSTYNSLPQATAVYPCREDFFLLPMGSLTFLGWFAPQGKLILVERFLCNVKTHNNFHWHDGYCISYRLDYRLNLSSIVRFGTRF